MAACVLPYTVLMFGLSDVGLVRQNNEDFWMGLTDPQFYVLADGMGGHQAGEIAAQETALGLCEIVQNQWKNAGRESFHDMRKAMRIAIEQVNRKVYKKSRMEPSLKGMGTTVCCIYFHTKGVIYAHVGDSRIYRLRKTRFEQLTKDHSLRRELIDQGELTEKQARDFLYPNIITKAVGTEPNVEPSVHLSDLVEGDIYLMCSDGLSDLLSTREMHAILNQKMTLEDTVKEFIATAHARGGHDNITVVMMKVTDVEKKSYLS